MTSDIKRSAALELIRPRRKRNPISRAELSDLLKISDRQARSCIESLREEGVRICGTSCGNGYYFADNEEQFKQFIRDYESKAWTIIRRSRAMQNSEEGQVSL